MGKEIVLKSIRIHAKWAVQVAKSTMMTNKMLSGLVDTDDAARPILQNLQKEWANIMQ